MSRLTLGLFTRKLSPGHVTSWQPGTGTRVSLALADGINFSLVKTSGRDNSYVQDNFFPLLLVKSNTE